MRADLSGDFFKLNMQFRTKKLWRYFDFQQLKKSKAIPVTGLGGLYSCEMLRIPHCLDTGLTDGGKVVSRPHVTP
jgi:hypothetical protein